MHNPFGGDEYTVDTGRWILYRPGQAAARRRGLFSRGRRARQLALNGMIMDGERPGGYVLSGELAPPAAKDPVRRVEPLLRAMDQLDGRVLCVERGERFFSPGERMALAREGVRLAQSEPLRQISLFPAAMQAAREMQLRLVLSPALIVGADTPEGREWAMLLGDRMNFMGLCGSNPYALERLSDRLMDSFGLAAPIYRNLERAAAASRIVIFADVAPKPMLGALQPGTLAILTHPDDQRALPVPQGVQLLGGGRVAMPETVAAPLGLSSSEQHLVAQGWLYGTSALAGDARRLPLRARIRLWREMEADGFFLKGGGA
ncbi:MULTISPECIES: hypothetical protein [unclassified Clostridium]|uniref:hypothetical protein n=1 Tax=unclassified Clostridium TaxID=2614128 RepID=UPI001A9A9775|nr:MULTISPECIES: hypothetical protein [unclassified Clostridium]